jgi:hypothetical protein
MLLLLFFSLEDDGIAVLPSIDLFLPHLQHKIPVFIAAAMRIQSATI